MPNPRDAVGRHLPFKLGKLPARPGAVTFKFAAFAVKERLPTPPKVFGHQGVIGDWLMLGNDRWGCCVFSGGAHETMMWSKIGDAPDASFNDACIAKDYGAVTGFKINDPNTDQGTDMSAAASYQPPAVVSAPLLLGYGTRTFFLTSPVQHHSSERNHGTSSSPKRCGLVTRRLDPDYP